MRHAAIRFGILLASAVAAWAAQSDCATLSKANFPHVSITAAASVAAGPFAPASGQPIPNLPAFCRVAGVIKPSPDSDIQFEVWMPQSSWNGKYLGVGNGGFAGAISFSQMATALSRGYATSSTDTGHQAGGIDAGWALGHPEKVTD